MLFKFWNWNPVSQKNSISKANADKPESQDAAREGVRSILKDVEHHLGRFRKGYFTGNYSYR